jgi:hypothetical protein
LFIEDYGCGLQHALYWHGVHTHCRRCTTMHICNKSSYDADAFFIDIVVPQFGNGSVRVSKSAF